MKRGYTTYSGVIVDILYDSFSVFQKMCFLLALLISIPWQVENRSKTLRFAPFTFPTSLPLIIQQATRNIENKESNVTKWSYTVEDEDDIEALKRIILWQKDFHPIVRSFCVRVDSKVALEVIKELTPTLFLGTIGNRCAILGRIEYDSYEKIYREYFFFDNRHVKDEFKSIAEIEIAEQKKLKQQIPTNLIDLMRRLALGKEK